MDQQLSMFDTVRIRSTPLTEKLGLAGLVGTINGQTTPSFLPPGEIQAIGELTTDYAIPVDFEQEVLQQTTALGDEIGGWFAPELLEMISKDPASDAKFDAIIQKNTPGTNPGFKKPGWMKKDQ